MKQKAETKTDIEKKIDQCNRRLGLISDSSNELNAVSADLENWQRNLSPAEQDRLKFIGDLSARKKRVGNHL